MALKPNPYRELEKAIGYRFRQRDGLESALLHRSFRFENGEIDGAFGAGWMVSTDEMIGGSSTGDMAVVDGGANGSAHAMRVTGTR